MSAEAIVTTSEVRLVRKRCWTCGRHWAVEAWGVSCDETSDCPACTRQARGTLSGEVTRLQRSNAALRGLVAQLKRRRR